MSKQTCVLACTLTAATLLFVQHQYRCNVAELLQYTAQDANTASILVVRVQFKLQAAAGPAGTNMQKT